ncbi:MAG: proton-conducting membrane transporter [Actinomycetia bacterium]|nr:proton-conducting membrane transporter [Actinomycetes bacterium]MCP4227136.1 proton-conducting membrane transporter [Actinomycetes bacterium]MCP5033034.1 proton-conducting membrane transporter [Actinomycetes bacterium]
MADLDVSSESTTDVEETDVDEEPKRMVLVCWSSDLDRVWPVMILATTAAASGLEVDIFFTFWGLRALQKPDKRITGSNWKQRGESFMDKGGAENLTLGKMHMGGMGTSMIKSLAKEHGVASPAELMEMAQDMGVRLHPCQMTMDLYGLSEEDFIGGLEPVCGAANFIDMAASADIQMFI